jgi:hypothetical protein
VAWLSLSEKVIQIIFFLTSLHLPFNQTRKMSLTLDFLLPPPPSTWAADASSVNHASITGTNLELTHASPLD